MVPRDRLEIQIAEEVVGAIRIVHRPHHRLGESPQNLGDDAGLVSQPLGPPAEELLQPLRRHLGALHQPVLEVS